MGALVEDQKTPRGRPRKRQTDCVEEKRAGWDGLWAEAEENF